jgi:hypothetical protein
MILNANHKMHRMKPVIFMFGLRIAAAGSFGEEETLT